MIVVMKPVKSIVSNSTCHYFSPIFKTDGPAPSTDCYGPYTGRARPVRTVTVRTRDGLVPYGLLQSVDGTGSSDLKIGEIYKKKPLSVRPYGYVLRTSLTRLRTSLSKVIQ
jgi:hypothetical protein